MKFRLHLLLLLALALSFVSMASADDIYYLTAGDQHTMTIVNLNTQTWYQTPLSGNEYAIAAFPGTGEVTVGAYGNNGAFYDTAGNFLHTVNNANTSSGSQWLDGTTDLTHNYTVDFFNGNVYQTDTSFNNASVLFNAGDAFTLTGITYDSANGNLWLADRYGNPGTITEYTLSGTPLFSFGTGISFIGALAYEASNNTLWVTTRSEENCDDLGTCLFQYDTNGNLLQTFDIPVRDNIIGGEIAPIPEPGTLLLMASGALALFGVVRRKVSL